MSAKSTPSTPAQPAPEAVPATQYERFLAALPESFRQQCHSKLKDSGLAANHPAFLALAELYEKRPEKPPRDFIQEATLHADQSSQLLNELKNLPGAIMGKIEPQLHGLLSALSGPVQRLEAVATTLQAPASAPPVSATAQPSQDTKNHAEKREKHLGKAFAPFFGTVGSTLANPVAWMVTGSLSFTCAVTILFLGAAHLSRYYEAAYQDRVSHMEADSATNTVALNRLLIAGITLNVQRAPDGTGWYLICPVRVRRPSPSIRPKAWPSKFGPN